MSFAVKFSEKRNDGMRDKDEEALYVIDDVIGRSVEKNVKKVFNKGANIWEVPYLQQEISKVVT